MTQVYVLRTCVLACLHGVLCWGLLRLEPALTAWRRPSSLSVRSARASPREIQHDAEVSRSPQYQLSGMHTFRAAPNALLCALKSRLALST